MTEPDTAWEAFCASGLWPTLGRVTAGRLPAAHINGPDDVSIEALSKVEGVADKRATTLFKTFTDAQPRWAVAQLLHAAGLPVRAASAAVDQLGSGAAEALRSDPWRLLDAALEPAEVDRFALAVVAAQDERPGRDDRRRGRALTVHVLARAARDGHTVTPLDIVDRALAGLGFPTPDVAIDAALEDGQVERFDEDPEHPVLGLVRYAAAEDAVAEGLARLFATAEPIATPEGVTAVTAELDPAQREAVRQFAEHGVAVLHGGPGTGKSRTVAAVVELAGARGRELALAAPTGRAAKRLEELTDHPASTLHRLLGAQGTTGQFARGEGWPLDADIVVVDEASMLDVELAAALVDACADGTHLLLVGDPAQLPSIGPGRVLADILAAGVVPAVELTTLHRQAEGGAIARLAGAVRGGELPPVDDPDREVVITAARDSVQAAHRVAQLVTDSIPRALGIPAADIQVVTPVHRGPAGTVELNRVLKAALNPGPGAVSGYDVGDRVVATANHLDDGYANGEVGVVTFAADGRLEVDFSGFTVSVAGRAIGDLRHGWAITVHRGQGSEWPAVVAVMPPEAGGMLSRPLVYTALTRAQRHLSVVHAAGPALPRAVREVGARPRRTRLAGLMSG
jgi:exodeoxyribonuclease V alpha subunit